MKNQYFGDVNDYCKYGLIRTLTDCGALPTIVCWMLTADDESSDGRHIAYLQQPDKWRTYDVELYDHLYQAVMVQECRDIRFAREASLLPSARFYDALLSDDRASRAEYWRLFWELAGGSTLVFFDPDNGLEVQSTPYGRKGSCKYLYWHELNQTLSQGYSALVYQHFGRVKHERFTEQMAQEMHRRTKLDVIYSFRTNRIVFFLLPVAYHLPSFESRIPHVRRAWEGPITVVEHRRAQDTA